MNILQIRTLAALLIAVVLGVLSLPTTGDAHVAYAESVELSIAAAPTQQPVAPLLSNIQVRLDPKVRTLVWPNGAGFDPYVLDEWPRAVGQLAQRLRQPVIA